MTFWVFAWNYNLGGELIKFSWFCQFHRRVSSTDVSVPQAIPLPRDQRYCKYCRPVPGPGGQPVRPVDDEWRCLTSCIVGSEYRPALFVEIARRNCKFTQLFFFYKLETLVCPISPTDTKQVIRFLEKQFRDRDQIDSCVGRGYFSGK